VIERLALDTDAAVDYIREDRRSPPQINDAEAIALPLTVIGELFYGAECSARPDQNRGVIEAGIERWEPLFPSIETARIYGRIRAGAFGMTDNLTASKRNDLWIAALCIQHDLPLLTNDRGFDRIAGLSVIHC
jgi:tRNA(fMet)-specific endonuclease VapC